VILNIPCIILAGGKSSRMGQDKSLLPFKNHKTLAQYQYDKLSKIFSKVYISSKTDKFNFKADIILDDILDISSPMVALQTILKNISEKKVFIIAVDVPFVKIDTIKQLINRSKNYDIVYPKDNNKSHFLCGVFDKKILPKIDTLLCQDIHKIKQLINNTNSKDIYINHNKQFLNINTIQQYEKI
jgi:molybdopterin-guanine dinucleotide biosynthesis protein A